MCRARVVSPEQPVLCIPVWPTDTTVLTTVSPVWLPMKLTPKGVVFPLLVFPSLTAWSCQNCAREGYLLSWLHGSILHHASCTHPAPWHDSSDADMRYKQSERCLCRRLHANLQQPHFLLYIYPHGHHNKRHKWIEFAASGWRPIDSWRLLWWPWGWMQSKTYGGDSSKLFFNKHPITIVMYCNMSHGVSLHTDESCTSVWVMAYICTLDNCNASLETRSPPCSPAWLLGLPLW